MGAATPSADPAPEMTDSALMRDALLRMQREFASTVQALEKQAAGLAAHNALLADAQQQQLAEIASLREQLTSAEHARRQEQLAAQEREQALQHECAALKLLLAQEQGYWERFERSKQAEVEKLHAQAADARAEAQQTRERSDGLCREMQQLQSRVDAAARTSRSLEQRLKILAHQKHDEQAALEAEVQRLQRKLSDKREQNKYLSEALVAREDAASRRRRQQQTQSHSQQQQQAPASVSSTSSVLSDPITDDTISSARPRLRKRDVALSLPPAAPVSKRLAPTGKPRRHEDSLLSHALTSPTASSPDLTPPPSPSSVQRDAPRPARPAAERLGQHPLPDRRRSARLEREMSDLRRKLDACMQRP